MDINKLDKRYKKTQNYLKNGTGKPIYKRRAFPFIDKKLGTQFKWIDKSPEEYFGNDDVKKARKVCIIFSFTGKESFSNIKTNYRRLCKGSVSEHIPGFHPDVGGHESALAILNEAYNIFKDAFYNEEN